MYNINYDLSWDGIFKFKTDSNCEYIVSIKKTTPVSKHWTVNFRKKSGQNLPEEVFKIMKTCAYICNEYADLKSINKVVLFIEGDNDKIISKKANIFTKWMIDWNYEISDVDMSYAGFYIKTKLINLERK